jgi:fatty-acid desaturase
MAVSSILSFFNSGITLLSQSVQPFASQLPLVILVAYYEGCMIPSILDLLCTFLITYATLTFGMSVCLHRFFSHQAFKCNSAVAFMFGLVGTLTNQSGILWWASKHNRHHKYCDKKEDPHSWTQTNAWQAWVGWQYTEYATDMQYVPKVFRDQPLLQFLNTFNIFVIASFMYFLQVNFGSHVMIWYYWVPTIICAIATFRFNLRYHPYDPMGEIMRNENKANGITVNSSAETSTESNLSELNDENSAKSKERKAMETEAFATKSCKARNQPDSSSKFSVEHLLSSIAGEGDHDDHHQFPRRAHRPGFDLAYLTLLGPLESFNLIECVKIN